MSRVERFEDLIAWQKARALTQEVYRATHSGAFAKDFGLSGQLQRAAVSIMSNIAEGFERGGRGEFHQFLSIAKASCAEVRSLPYVALDAAYLAPPAFDHLLALAEEVARIIGGLRAAVERQRAASQQLRETSEGDSSVLSPQSSALSSADLECHYAQ